MSIFSKPTPQDPFAGVPPAVTAPEPTPTCKQCHQSVHHCRCAEEALSARLRDSENSLATLRRELIAEREYVKKWTACGDALMAVIPRGPEFNWGDGTTDHRESIVKHVATLADRYREYGRVEKEVELILRQPQRMPLSKERKPSHVIDSLTVLDAYIKRAEAERDAFYQVALEGNGEESRVLQLIEVLTQWFRSVGRVVPPFRTLRKIATELWPQTAPPESPPCPAPASATPTSSAPSSSATPPSPSVSPPT